MANLSTDRFCINCGLPQPWDPGISGCSGETIAEHRYVDPAARPFESWDRLRLERRERRALVKALSSRAVVLHLRDCPARAYGADMLYTEKFIKRVNLAAQIGRELVRRGVVTGFKRGALVDAERLASVIAKEITDHLVTEMLGRFTPGAWKEGANVRPD